MFRRKRAQGVGGTASGVLAGAAHGAIVRLEQCSEELPEFVVLHRQACLAIDDFLGSGTVDEETTRALEAVRDLKGVTWVEEAIERGQAAGTVEL